LPKSLSSDCFDFENDPGGSRTRDLRIKSPLLYQLSYRVGTANLEKYTSTDRNELTSSWPRLYDTS
jgi:hypothetical protein